MRSYEFTGKNVQKAIEEGLRAINKKQEEVDIQVINEGGLFKKAKIVITIEEPVFEFKSKREENEEKPNKKVEVKEKVEEISENVETLPQSEEKTENLTENNDVVEEVVEVKENVEEVVETAENINNVPHTEEVLFEENHASNNVGSKAFLEKYLSILGIEGTVELRETRENSEITIETENASNLIGRHGEGLNSLQFLTNVIEQKTNPTAKRVVIDVAGYKERREEKLRALAIKVAGKVEATKRPHKFEPMNAYERRIIHTELQNYASVETHSEGVEPRRRLVVTFKKR